MIEIPVYAPWREESAPADEIRMGDGFARTVAGGSGIVGAIEDLGIPGATTIVYYEGNLYGAVNMVTLADRAMFAYYRMRDDYPTIAKALVPFSQLRRIGTLYPEHARIEVADAVQLAAVARWLGIDLADGRDATDRLHSELRCDGVRARG